MNRLFSPFWERSFFLAVDATSGLWWIALYKYPRPANYLAFICQTAYYI
jgi:hypothetical protein